MADDSSIQANVRGSDLHCTLHNVATSSCHGHADKLATEPFLLLHREHGTGYDEAETAAIDGLILS